MGAAAAALLPFTFISFNGCAAEQMKWSFPTREVLKLLLEVVEHSGVVQDYGFVAQMRAVCRQAGAGWLSFFRGSEIGGGCGGWGARRGGELGGSEGFARPVLR